MANLVWYAILLVVGICIIGLAEWRRLSSRPQDAAAAVPGRAPFRLSEASTTAAYAVVVILVLTNISQDVKRSNLSYMVLSGPGEVSPSAEPAPEFEHKRGFAFLRSSLLTSQLSTLETQNVPISPDGYFAVGKAVFSDTTIAPRERLQTALHFFQETVKRDPYHYRAYTSIGVVYFLLSELEPNKEQARNLNLKAIEAHRRAVEINPAYVNAYSNMGISLYLVGREQEAIEAEEKAIQVDPAYPESYYNLACIYSLRNEKEVSLRWLEDAIKHGYNNLNEMRSDSTLDNIRNEPGYRRLEALLESTLQPRRGE